MLAKRTSVTQSLVNTQNLNIYRYSYKTETAIFKATKYEKNNYDDGYLNFCKYFLNFELLASSTKKFKNFLGINSSKFLAHTRGHTGTLSNGQNSCIKLFGLTVDTTRFFLRWEITRNISCREKFLKSNYSFAGH